jgi:hypothetical protein
MNNYKNMEAFSLNDCSFSTIPVNVLLQEEGIVERNFYDASFHDSMVDQSPLAGKELWVSANCSAASRVKNKTIKAPQIMETETVGEMDEDEISQLSGWSRLEQKDEGDGDDYSISSSIFSDRDHDDQSMKRGDQEDDIETIEDDDGDDDDDLETIDHVPQQEVTASIMNMAALAPSNMNVPSFGTGATMVSLEVVNPTNGGSNVSMKSQYRQPLQNSWRGNDTTSSLRVC